MNNLSPAAESRFTLNVRWLGPFAVLLAVLLAAALLRIFFAGQPLWLDELHTAWAIDCDFSKLPHRAGQGNQTPLYFLLLWVGQAIFGFSHGLLRWPSVACGLLSIVAASWLTWRFSRCWAAVFTVATILAFDSFQLFYSSEARPYALLQLIAVVQIGAIACWAGSPENKSWLATTLVSLSTFALMLTHITGIWLVAAEMIFFAIAWRFAPLPHFAASVFSGALAMLIYKGLFTQVFQNREDWWVVSNSSLYFWQIGVVLFVQWLIPVAGWLATRLTRDLPETDSNECRTNLGAQPDSRGSQTYLVMIVCVSILPVIFVSILEQLRIAPVASVRYAFVAMVPMTLCCGMLIARISELWIRNFVAIMVVLSGFVFNPVAIHYVKTGTIANLRHENWNEAVQKIDDAPLVFLFPNLIEDNRLKTWQAGTPEFEELVNYLRFPLTSPATTNVAGQIIPMPTRCENRWSATHLELLLQHQYGWIVMRSNRSLASEIINELENFAATNDVDLKTQVLEQERNDVRLVRLELKQ